MIAISLGDVTGIGPEVTLKALAAQGQNCSCIIVGDEGVLAQTNERLGLHLRWKKFVPGMSQEGALYIHDPSDAPLPLNLPCGAPEASRAAVTWLEGAARLCLAGQADAMVTAPVNKEAIMRAGIPFVGQTEFLAGLAKTRRFAMMLMGADERGRWIRVVLATTHLPLRQVPEQLSREKVELAIELAAESCRLLGLPRARVGVCGLNPHAGEGGKLGTEEQTLIEPAIAATRQKGLDVSGPHPADSLFYYAFKGDYDVVVAMYHDQGLAPLKMIGFESGINWTLGLPFMRTSPDHGTAYDIAGKGLASPSSMLAAMGLACKLGKKSLKRNVRNTAEHLWLQIFL
jgi:4-hydroxythreonine-4-phosphate dehydrogenase